MTLATELLRIRDFLQAKVSPQITLCQPMDDATEEEQHQVKHPEVHIGQMPPPEPEQPPPQLSPTAFPSIIVGLGDTQISTSNPSTIGLRLCFAVYHPKDQPQADANPALNTQGYLDLVNLMDLTIRELFANHYPGLGRASLKCGLYPHQPNLYWYGWMTFTVAIAPQGTGQQGYESNNVQVQNLLKG